MPIHVTPRKGMTEFIGLSAYAYQLMEVTYSGTETF